MVEDVNILTSPPGSENPVVVQGFPGIGLVGNIASQHLIEELGMKYMGSIDSRFFPPIAVLFNGLVNMPVRIYESPENSLVVMISDIPIHPTTAYDISKALANWVESIGCREVVSLAGIATMTDKRRVFGGATSPELLERIKDKVDVFQVGTVSGISGSIMTECFIRGIPAISLLGETHSPNPDPRAAAAVVEVLNKIYNLSVDTGRLISQAEQIEAELQKLAEQVTTTEAQPTRKEFPMYG